VEEYKVKKELEKGTIYNYTEMTGTDRKSGYVRGEKYGKDFNEVDEIDRTDRTKLGK